MIIKKSYLLSKYDRIIINESKNKIISHVMKLSSQKNETLT